MKKTNLLVFTLVMVLLIVNVFLVYFYYSEIAYPIEDPTSFEEMNEMLEDCTVIKEYKDEYPFSDHLRTYLIEKKDGRQCLIVLELFPYFARYQMVSENDVPTTRPCTVSIDFFGRVYDFTLNEENVFQKLDSSILLNTASPVFLLMPVIGLPVFGVEAALVYFICNATAKKNAKSAG